MNFSDYFSWFAEQVLRWPATEPTLQDIDGEATVLWFIFVVFVFALGILVVDLFLFIRPNTFDRSSASSVLPTLIAVPLGFVILGFVYPDLVSTSLGYVVSGPVVLVAGCVFMQLMARKTSSPANIALVQDEFKTENIIRPKQLGDLWIWAIAPEVSNESDFLSSVRLSIDTFCAGSYWNTEYPAFRTIKTDTCTVGEFGLTQNGEQDVRIRFWESDLHHFADDDFPPVSEMDGIVILIKPPDLQLLESSLPFGDHRNTFDGSERILDITKILREQVGDRIPPVWLVIQEPDTLRFSTYEPLIKFPVEIGPKWYDQMSTMSIQERERLVEILSLEKALDASLGVNWGTGNPLLCFAPHSGSPELPFGGKEFLDFFMAGIPATKFRSR